MLIASAYECINKNCLVDCNQKKRQVANLYHDITNLASVHKASPTKAQNFQKHIKKRYSIGKGLDPIQRAFFKACKIFADLFPLTDKG